ncbi:MAG TPA: hypothetical protein VIS07_05955 [Candidatus Binatia bacterium]
MRFPDRNAVVPKRRALCAASLLAILGALQLLLACTAVEVRRGETTLADVQVPTQPTTSVNILGIGRADAEGRIVLRPTGISVSRGETAIIGLSGPGMIPGTGFVVLGFGFQANVVRYAETQGGSGTPQPAVVLSLTVPADTPPGLYSIMALRGYEFAMMTAAIEVT